MKTLSTSLAQNETDFLQLSLECVEQAGEAVPVLLGGREHEPRRQLLRVISLGRDGPGMGIEDGCMDDIVGG
jgi:hypothetical protein